jgi:hypothetical protein
MAQIQHLKFPETLGESGTINWNSNVVSADYAERRVSESINETSAEPFILFEFLEVVEGSGTNKIQASIASITELETPMFETLKEITKQLITTPLVKRNLRGSVALYMTTDIQINDTMNYAEDTRKFMAIVGDFINEGISMDSITDLLGGNVSALTAATGAVAGKAIGALAGYGLGDVIATEYTRVTGKVTNPNEFLNYQSTPLRSFSFSFKFLPSSSDESEEVTMILKMFRSAAHATKKSAVTLLVPDHLVVSFHGSKDMIQMPPVAITGVSVVYNPNTVSFFNVDNAPVEIDMTLTLQELVPIYKEDVMDNGY